MFESLISEFADGAQDQRGQVELVNITAGEIQQATGAGKFTGLSPILFVKNKLISPTQHLGEAVGNREKQLQRPGLPADAKSINNASKERKYQDWNQLRC